MNEFVSESGVYAVNTRQIAATVDARFYWSRLAESIAHLPERPVVREHLLTQLFLPLGPSRATHEAGQLVSAAEDKDLEQTVPGLAETAVASLVSALTPAPGVAGAVPGPVEGTGPGATSSGQVPADIGDLPAGEVSS